MHYEDAWGEAHAAEFERKKITSQNRRQLLETLNAEEMIRIMFKDYLHKLSDSKVDEMKREYIDSRIYNPIK